MFLQKTSPKSIVITLALVSSFLSAQVQAKEVNITFHNRLIDGAKVWVPEPESIKIKKGATVKVQLINHLEDAHGFHLPQFTDPLVVPGKLKNIDAPNLTFAFQANEKPGKYDFRCHMHPAHVGGSFQIVE